MKRTLLDLTQSILSSLSSDEVNSLSDSTEALQVAEIIKSTYFNIISRTTLPSHQQLIQLQPSLDANSPVLMYVPEGIAKIEWIKYFNSNVADNATTTGLHDINTDIVSTTFWTTTSTTSNSIGLGTHTFTLASPVPTSVGAEVSMISGANSMLGTVTTYVGTSLTVNVLSITGTGTFSSWTISSVAGNGTLAVPGYEYVTIVPIQQFIDTINTLNPVDDNVETFTFSDTSNNYNGTYTFYYRNDRTPKLCTVLSDYYVIFDSFDATVDSTLQASKSMAFGQVIPTWSMTDTFVPSLNDEQVTLLLNEAKSLAFFELKQQVHAKAEQEARRGWTSIQKKKYTVNSPTDFDALPNFGRTGTNPHFSFQRSR